MNEDSNDQPVDLLSASSLVAASMIGAGVFTTSGFTLGDLQSPWLVLAAWAVAGLIAISGAICYGALAMKFTESGGEYLFLSRSLHPVAGMMAGWVSLLAGFTGAIAFAATAFAEYLQPIWAESLAIPTAVTASGVVLLAALLHAVGVKEGARVQDGVVILKFVLVAAFVAVAVFSRSWSGLPSETNPTESETWLGYRFATALMWISLSYSGFNAAVYVAGEVKNPRRNVPRAIIVATLLVTVAYLLLNWIFVFAPPADKIMFQKEVATIAAEHIGGASFAVFVRVVILVCLFTSVSANIMSGPRVYAKMADDGFLPRFFRFRNRPPAEAIWLQAGLAVVVICISDLRGLLDYLGFTLSVSAALTASMLFFVRREPGMMRWYPWPVILFVGGTLLTATLAAVRDPAQALVGVATILFGAVVYPFYAKRNARTS